MVFDPSKAINQILGKTEEKIIKIKEPNKKLLLNKYPKIHYIAHDWIGVQFGNVFYEIELKSNSPKEEISKIKKMTFIQLEKKYTLDLCGNKKPNW